jgi:hypothetical protein
MAYRIHNTARALGLSLASLSLTVIAVGNINLELRTDAQIYTPSSVVDVELVAVSDSESDQLMSATQIVITWNNADLSLTAVDATGLGWSLAGLIDDPYGLNEAALPEDGNAIFLGAAPPDAPIAATPAGRLMAVLQFTCVRETASTTIAVQAGGGAPAGATAVYDSVLANQIVTGTRGSVSFRIEDCIEDLDGDDSVDLDDLATLLAHYGMTSGATLADGDFDGDADVDLNDLTRLLAVYGLNCT